MTFDELYHLHQAGLLSKEQRAALHQLMLDKGMVGDPRLARDMLKDGYKAAA